MKATAALLAFGFLATGATAQDKPARKANFTVSKETTYVTGPLDKDGYVDYAAALNERLGKGVTADTNASVLIWKALGPRRAGEAQSVAFFKIMGMDRPPEDAEYFMGLQPFLRDRLRIADQETVRQILKGLASATSRPWVAGDHPRIADWLKANEKPLALFRTASKRPQYFSPFVPQTTEKGSGGLISVPTSGLEPCRGMANALCARAMLRLGDGKVDDACEDLIACHRFGRLVAHGGFLVESLVGRRIDETAVRVDLALLDRSEVDGKRLLGYLRELRGLPPMPGISMQVDIVERFTHLDSVMLADRTGVRFIREFSGPLAEGEERPPEGPMENVDWDPAMRNINRWFDRLAAATRGKDRAARDELLSRIEADLKDFKVNLIRSNDSDKALRGVGLAPAARGERLGDLLFGLMNPAVRKLQNVSDHNEQGQRNLHVAFALAAYQRDHGTYPKTLEALAPKYLDKVPDDLFTGKPLVYRPSEKGFVIYSLGPNGKDDGGRAQRDDPPGDDIAVRVPVPQK